MAIFTGGKSTAINSPRHLTLRQARRAVGSKKLSLGILAPDEVVPEPELNPGEEKLNSYWAPGLEAGQTHRVNITQTIDPKTDENPLTLTAEQDFFVDAPQFSLPEGSIHSVYPPPGYSDDHRILPHVVLTDPHLPWERLGSPKLKDNKDDRNRVPWLALLSFTQDELRLGPEVLDGETSIFKNTSAQLSKPVRQTSVLAVNMSVGDLLATTDIVTPVTPNLGNNISDSRGDFIFVRPDLFKSLFSTFDSSNQRQVPDSPNTSQYKFLSHVRKINTTGMAISGVEDIGVFSVVVGNRSGPLQNAGATSIAVHLVSIEGVEDMKFPSQESHVALCSLHSWNYTVEPPGMLNVPDAFESIGRTLSVLRLSDAVIDPLKSAGKIPARLASRFEDGYSLVKYRTQTGEQTVALFRGPFTPTVVPNLSMSNCSNSGVDLQILDKEVGIMDITYSSAWQLGRTLALGDQAFTAALARLRTAIHNRAMKESKIIAVTEKSENSFRTRNDVLGDLPDMVRSLDQIHIIGQPADSGDQALPFKPGGPLKRWYRSRLSQSEIPSLAFSAPMIVENYLEQATEAARALAKSIDGTIYDETNSPVSTDWMIVLAWVMNRMFLAGVPAHYLITDPSHLEQESLRFFHIDSNWVDAMIDGALSLANHMGVDKDRVAIKTALNDYIKSKPELLAHAPQIPTYGFFLRSDLVSMFPDLRVTTLPPQPNPPVRAPLLRHEIVTNGVMLALLDRIPGSDEFNGLVFTQPPHQQRFAVARDLEADSITVNIRRQYTVEENIRQNDPNRHLVLEIDNLPMHPSDSHNLFVWGSTPGLTDLHILRLPYFAELQLQELVNHMGSPGDGSTNIKYFDDDTANSALFALQLNDPIYNLTIGLTTPGTLPALAGLAPLAGGAETQAPRTLKLLNQSSVERFTATGEPPRDHDSPIKPDHDALAESATFERHKSYIPAPQVLANLAPHVRAIPTETTTSPVLAPTPKALSIASSGDDQPATAPKYHCSIYNPGLSSIQIGDGLPSDLVFSVLVRDNENSSYQLTEFDILILLGDINPDRNILMKDYDGPGPSMLSNLRFNVLTAFSTINGSSYLQLRLLPRSSKGIGISSVSEMGFLLSLAKVNEFTARQTLLNVETLAYYQNDDFSPRKDEFLVSIINHNVSD
ncbi:hypothetical protein MMC31_002895 [Peltigera leucophlebia]|nr:hypothetical protein [Peltigera leucophlebia]